MNSKIPILVINDDGISSPGLLSLVRELSDTQRFDIRVVAPAQEQSGVAFHITLSAPIFVEKTILPGTISAIEAYIIWGTPVDCVKLALEGLIPDFHPRLVLSGINRGSNIAQVIPYSGTVAAALEATLNDIPAIAFSLDSSKDGMWNYLFAAEICTQIATLFLDAGVKQCGMLNVNIPNRLSKEIKGLKFVPQGKAYFKQHYIEEDPDVKTGRRRFRLEGQYEIPDRERITDASALADGWVTVTPLGVRLEDLQYLEALGTTFISDLENIKR